MTAYSHLTLQRSLTSRKEIVPTLPKITASHMLCFRKRYLFAASSALTYGEKEARNSNDMDMEIW